MTSGPAAFLKVRLKPDTTTEWPVRAIFDAPQKWPEAGTRGAPLVPYSLDQEEI